MDDSRRYDPIVRPGGVMDFTLAAVLLVLAAGSVIALLFLLAVVSGPSAVSGPFPWS